MDQLVLVKHLYRVRMPWSGAFQKHFKNALWNNENFRFFLMSECAGIFGNYFYQIALPWLVMEFTGSAGAMGTSIVLSGVSRMALMMVGGSLSDRFSPRVLMVAGAALRALLLVLIIGIVLLGRMDLLVLYGFSLAAGLTDAIFLPARGSVLPLLVEQELLKAANSILTAQEKLWSLVGPTLAGFIITWINRSNNPAGAAQKDFLGPVAAFVINVLALILSIVALRAVKFSIPALQPVQNVLEPAKAKLTRGSLRELIDLFKNQASLRMAFLMVYAINVISSGPLYIGLPMLVVSRFPEGAQALGLMTSALGGGALLGTLLAGLLPQPCPQKMRRQFLYILAGLAAGLVVLVTVISASVDIAVVVIVAGLISYVNVTGIAQIQRETPPAFMGRMMGLLNMK
jgi:MFS family permease